VPLPSGRAAATPPSMARVLGCAPMTGDSVDCFNCGRSNPSWAQVCRSCGVPMRPGGAGARPPSGPFPTDRDSLLSIGGGLATMVLAIGIGLMLSGMLPEAASVIETPTPEPTVSIEPTPSVAPTKSPKPTPEPTPELLGTVTFGRGLDRSTREVTDRTDTFGPGDLFCHSVALRQRFGVTSIQEEVLRLKPNGTGTVVQARSDGTFEPIDPNTHIFGICGNADVLIGAWGPGDYLLRDYRQRNGLQLISEGRFTLTE
jgi:hypothetical protein